MISIPRSSAARRSRAATKRRGLNRQQRRTVTFFLFISPWLIMLVAVGIIPLGLGVLTSLTNYDGLNLARIKFVGLRNYARAFADPDVSVAVRSTIYWTLLSLPAGLVCTFAVAALANQSLKGIGLFRTLVLAVNVTLISVFVSAMCGYAFARFQVPGNKQLFSVVISLLIVPNIVILIPQFILFSRLRLTNTYWPWFLGALGGNAYFIFMFRHFFLSFPRELEDAAEIDGAGPLRMFLQIFLPNAKPVLATAGIFNVGWTWGDYLMPIIYLTERNTLLGVKMARSFMDPGGHEMQTVRLAASVIYVLPLVALFFIGQKNILKGVVTTGLKG